MLTEERFNIILDILEQEKSVSATTLIKATHSSASTIRRDLSQLENLGKLQRVHGGAIYKGNIQTSPEDKVERRRMQNVPQKRSIGKKAAQLIRPGDFVYLDAGTTTEMIISEISTDQATFVTNAISHAKALAQRGFNVSLIGGEFKDVTEAIVGEEATEFILRYNFTKGFFGANGIDEKGTLNTPDSKEAAIKKAAMAQCEHCYIVADPSKFSVRTVINFGHLKGNTLITCPPINRKQFPADCRVIYANEEDQKNEMTNSFLLEEEKQ